VQLNGKTTVDLWGYLFSLHFGLTYSTLMLYMGNLPLFFGTELNALLISTE